MNSVNINILLKNWDLNGIKYSDILLSKYHKTIF